MMSTNAMRHVHYDDTSLLDCDEEHNLKVKEAMRIIYGRLKSRKDVFHDPMLVKRYLFLHYSGYERECFSIMLLDNQHRLIRMVDLFFGTIDSASVYPREVAKTVLKYNAAAVIFSHNHPSGIAEPSEADKMITKRLCEALSLLDVRTLDHFVIGESHAVSFAERGLLKNV